MSHVTLGILVTCGLAMMSMVMNPAAAADAAPKTAKATLAGGCFWCTEAVFAELNGVKKVVSGYTNGTVPNPTYKQVCTGLTGHAEAIEVEYDPTVVSVAEKVIKALDDAKAFPAKIVTEVAKAEKFYPAEDYHQDFFANNPNQPYCRAVAGPKVNKVRKVFKDLVK